MIEFDRADKDALACFDPRTKVCTMNCGPTFGDPRSPEERRFLCPDCWTVAVGHQPSTINTTERITMNTPQHILPVALGAEFEDGYYGGRVIVGDRALDCCLLPRAQGYHRPMDWNDSNVRVDGALSFCDSDANTKAMAAAGSKLAQWALDNKMAIPAMDVLEQLYRIFKPSKQTNSQWMRSGINLSVMPPTYPYTQQDPAQTAIAAFREGGVEAFPLDALWTSTQSAFNAAWAWYQAFLYGSQDFNLKSSLLACRAVRMIPAAI